jgi:hypothetical protein
LSLAAAYSEIRARIQAQWPTLEPTVPLSVPDENFQEPEPPVPYLYFAVIWSGGEIITIGAPSSNRVRRDGWVKFIAMVPIGIGEQRGMDLIDKAISTVEGQDLGLVTFNGAEPGGQEATVDSGLYTAQVADVSFYFDDNI